MGCKKDAAKNKNSKQSNDNSSGLYEFANDQLGENKDASFKDLGKKAADKKNSKKKK